MKSLISYWLGKIGVCLKKNKISKNLVLKDVVLNVRIRVKGKIFLKCREYCIHHTLLIIPNTVNKIVLLFQI